MRNGQNYLHDIVPLQMIKAAFFKYNCILHITYYHYSLPFTISKNKTEIVLATTTTDFYCSLHVYQICFSGLKMDM